MAVLDPSGASGSATALERRARLLVFCMCLLAYGYFVYRGPHHNPDSRLALTYSLVDRHALDIDPYAETTLDRARANGHFYTDKAPGVSFALAPVYAVVRRVLPVSMVDLGSPDSPDRFIVRYLVTFLGLGVTSAVFVSVLFGWLGAFGHQVGPRLAVCLALGLGSPYFPFSVSAFGHVPAGIALGGAYMLLCAPRPARTWRSAIAAGALLGTSVLMEYPAALPAALLALIGLARSPRRLRGATALAVGAVGPIALLLAYHWAAFGSPLRAGYASIEPDSQYAAVQAQGFLGVQLPSPAVAVRLLAGPHRGLLVYAPWLLLAIPGAIGLWRRPGGRFPVIAAGGTVLLLLAVNSGYALWDGGASWGPRHLVPALPLLAVLALPAAARWPRVAWLLAGASILVTAAAVATGTLPDSEVGSPLTEALVPRVLSGDVTNNWGQLLGLNSWRGLVPALTLAAVLVVRTRGWRHSAGYALLAGWALVAAARLSRAYLDYSEGYYLYLGARMADGVALYSGVASTQPPLLPVLISALWRIQADVWLPRLLALGCYVAAAILAGRLARLLTSDWWAPGLAVALAAVLPLGASLPQVLDVNAVLAMVAPLLALSVVRAADRGSRAWGATAGALAAAGLATKLSFTPFALAAGLCLLAARQDRRPAARGLSLVAFLVTLIGCSTAASLAVWRVSGSAATDGITGELESPLLPAGALLAYLQLLTIEAAPLLLACLALRPALSHRGSSQLVAWFALAGLALPALAVHQGTFVGIARPAEPFIAALAPVGAREVWRWVRQRVLAAQAGRVLGAGGLAMLLLPPAWISGKRLLAPPPAAAEEVVLKLLDAPTAGGAVLAPPYYAALTRHPVLFDYPDWTVWGMRAAAGRPREVELAELAVSALSGREAGVVAADFRLAYIAPVQSALEQYYGASGTVGNEPSTRITFWEPR